MAIYHSHPDVRCCCGRFLDTGIYRFDTQLGTEIYHPVRLYLDEGETQHVATGSDFAQASNVVFFPGHQTPNTTALLDKYWLKSAIGGIEIDGSSRYEAATLQANLETETPSPLLNLTTAAKLSGMWTFRWTGYGRLLAQALAGNGARSVSSLASTNTATYGESPDYEGIVFSEDYTRYAFVQIESTINRISVIPLVVPQALAPLIVELQAGASGADKNRLLAHVFAALKRNDPELEAPYYILDAFGEFDSLQDEYGSPISYGFHWSYTDHKASVVLLKWNSSGWFDSTLITATFTLPNAGGRLTMSLSITDEGDVCIYNEAVVWNFVDDFIRGPILYSDGKPYVAHSYARGNNTSIYCHYDSDGTLQKVGYTVEHFSRPSSDTTTDSGPTSFCGEDACGATLTRIRKILSSTTITSARFEYRGGSFGRTAEEQSATVDSQITTENYTAGTCIDVATGASVGSPNTTSLCFSDPSPLPGDPCWIREDIRLQGGTTTRDRSVYGASGCVPALVLHQFNPDAVSFFVTEKTYWTSKTYIPSLTIGTLATSVRIKYESQYRPGTYFHAHYTRSPFSLTYLDFDNTETTYDITEHDHTINTHTVFCEDGTSKTINEGATSTEPWTQPPVIGEDNTRTPIWYTEESYGGKWGTTKYPFEYDYSDEALWARMSYMARNKLFLGWS